MTTAALLGGAGSRVADDDPVPGSGLGAEVSRMGGVLHGAERQGASFS